MCGATTADVDLSSQLFVELLPVFTGISKLLNHFLFAISTRVFLKNILLIRVYSGKQGYRANFQKTGKKELKMLKRAKYSKIWPKLNKI